MAHDSAINNVAHSAVKEFFRSVLTLVFVFLELPNIPPEICGNPIASGRIVVRKRGCESTQLTAAASVEEAAWQKRSGD
jgi:hypothetical protein